MAKKEVRFEVGLKRFRSLKARGENERDCWGISTNLELELSVRLRRVTDLEAIVIGGK